MRKHLPWLTAICLLVLFGTGAGPKPTVLHITIGGDAAMQRSIVDLPGVEFNKRLSIPVSISLDKVMPGCNGGVIPTKYNIVLSANAHGKYDPATGETFLRLEQESYSITLQDGIEPHVERERK